MINLRKKKVFLNSGDKQKIDVSNCTIKIIEKMLKNTYRVLIKMIKIRILYWEMVKSDGFNFLKIKNYWI